MNKSWKDPDTDLIHAIDREEPKNTVWAHIHEMPGLIELPLEEIAERFFRRVHTRCGLELRLDSDEFIIPHGKDAVQSLPSILRPWLTGREAPTCVVCAAAEPSKPMRNDWGSSLRGA